MLFTVDNGGYTPLMRLFIPIPEEIYDLTALAQRNGPEEVAAQLTNVLHSFEHIRLAFFVGLVRATVVAGLVPEDYFVKVTQKIDLDIIQAAFEGLSTVAASTTTDGDDASINCQHQINALYPSSDACCLPGTTHNFQTRILTLLGTTFHPRDFLTMLRYYFASSKPPNHQYPAAAGGRWDANNSSQPPADVYGNNIFHLYFQSLKWRANIAKQGNHLPKELFSHVRVSNMNMNDSGGGESMSRVMQSWCPRHNNFNNFFENEKDALVKTMVDTVYTLVELVGGGNCDCCSAAYDWLKHPNVRGELPLHIALTCCGVASSSSILLSEKDDYCFFSDGSASDSSSSSNSNRGGGPDRMMLRLLPMLMHADHESCFAPHPSSPNPSPHPLLSLKSMYPFMLTALQYDTHKANANATANEERSGCLSATYYLLRRFVARRNLSSCCFV
jgi:hypothetical protein